MKNVLIKYSFGLIIIFILVLILSYPLIFDTNKKNILSDKKISWGKGWNNKNSFYSGSEIDLLVKNSSSITLVASFSSSLQGLEVFIDDVENKPITPESKDNKQSYKIDPQEHKIRIRHFCTYYIDPCHAEVLGILIDNKGQILEYDNRKKTLSILGDSISTIYGKDNYSFFLADSLNYQLHNASVHGSAVSEIERHDHVMNRYKNNLIRF